MKKAVPCLLALLLLCGCHAKERIEMEPTSNKTVTFVNSVRDADAWILPQTAANLKTTVWGAATVPKAKTGESRQVPLCEAGDGGLYIFRMIDADGFFHSANGIVLEDGWRVKVGGEDGVVLEVLDGDGVLQKTHEVFSARL
jgi:hypothetical protein